MLNKFYVAIVLGFSCPLKSINFSLPSLESKKCSDLDALRMEIILANTTIEYVKNHPILVAKPSFDFCLFETTDPGCYEALGKSANFYASHAGIWKSLSARQIDELFLRDIRKANKQIIVAALKKHGIPCSFKEV